VKGYNIVSINFKEFKLLIRDREGVRGILTACPWYNKDVKALRARNKLQILCYALNTP